MSLFEYVMVLVSVVLSLGIARLLESHAHLLRLGGSVQWSPTYLLWLVLIFSCHFDLWASLWVMRTAASWTMPDLLATLLAAMTLFYSAVLSSPDLSSNAPIDLWEFHLANRRRYVGALAGYLIMGTVLNTFVLTENFQLASLTATLPGLTVCMVTIFVRNRWVQIAAPVVLAILFTAYFAQYFATFRG